MRKSAIIKLLALLTVLSCLCGLTACRERRYEDECPEKPVIYLYRERVCQDDFCKFSKFKYLSAEKTPNISCRHIS